MPGGLQVEAYVPKTQKVYPIPELRTLKPKPIAILPVPIVKHVKTSTKPVPHV